MARRWPTGYIKASFGSQLESKTASEKGDHMLRWAAAFFIIALIAAFLGFGGVAVAAAGIAKILFMVFLVLFLVALLGGLARRGV